MFKARALYGFLYQTLHDFGGKTKLNEVKYLSKVTHASDTPRFVS
jgi:hypothetical protein